MNISLPMIDRNISAIKSVSRRFPFVVLSAIITAGILITAAHDREYLFRLGSVVGLGIPLFFGNKFFAENLKEQQKVFLSQNLTNRLLDMIAIFFLIGFYFVNYELSSKVFYVKFFITCFALHLYVSISRFTQKNDTDAFWEFNKALFIRFIISTIYTVVLYIGLILCLATLIYLFKVKGIENLYVDIWFFCTFVFHILHFLAAIPIDSQEFRTNQSYPKGLQIFTQYLLIPLISVYALILYAYELKILIQWDLPRGKIAMMISTMAVLGILNLLLIYPRSKDEKEKWINKYSKYFYIGLLPLVGLLYFAIIKRLNDYGITEGRYYVFLIALWLTGISIYFLVSKRKEIRVIPISLLIASILSNFGPWGATEMTISSQFNKINQFLIDNQMLNNGKLVAPPIGMTKEKFKDTENTIRYFFKNYNIEKFNQWEHPEGKKLNHLSDLLDVIEFIKMKDHINLSYHYDIHSTNQNRKKFNYHFSGTTYAKNTKGFHYFSYIYLYSNPTYIHLNKDSKLKVNFIKNGEFIEFSINNKEIGKYNISNFVLKLKNQNSEKPNKMTNLEREKAIILHEFENSKIKLILTSVKGFEDNDRMLATELSGDIYFRLD